MNIDDLCLGFKINSYFVTFFTLSVLLFGGIKKKLQFLQDNKILVVALLSLFGSFALLSRNTFNVVPFLGLAFIFTAFAWAYLEKVEDTFEMKLTHLAIVFLACGGLLLLIHFKLPVTSSEQLLYTYIISIMFLAGLILRKHMIISWVVLFSCLVVIIFLPKQFLFSQISTLLHLFVIFIFYDYFLVRIFDLQERYGGIIFLNMFIGVLSFFFAMIDSDKLIRQMLE
jgi:hypothetical protein